MEWVWAVCGFLAGVVLCQRQRLGPAIVLVKSRELDASIRRVAVAIDNNTDAIRETLGSEHSGSGATPPTSESLDRIADMMERTLAELDSQA